MGRWGGGTPESEQGGGEALFGYGDMVDQLCVVYPIVHAQDVQTNFQKRQETKDAIVCDVVCLSRGPQDVVAVEHRMVMIFAGRFIGLSKRNCGAGLPGSQIPPLLGTVTQDNRTGPSSRTWVPLHENQGAVALADRWADTIGANFVPSTPAQVEQERARRQQQTQQNRNDQMGWPDDAQPRGGQQQGGGWGGGQQQRQQPQGGNWNQGGQQGPPQGGWNQPQNQAPQGNGQQGWNGGGGNQPVSGPPQGGWNQQAPQQNPPQTPSWAQQSATQTAPPRQNVPQGQGAQSTFDQMAQSQGFAGQGPGYAGGPPADEDPWASTQQPPY